MTKLERLEKSLLLGLCAAIFAAACADGTQNALAQKLTRIQIVANSDSDEDQRLKLQVRDTVAKLAQSLTQDCGSADEAQAVLRAALPQLRDTAQACVYAAGRVTPVQASVEQVWYPTREYGSFRLPAGEYTALRVVLGEGEGHNWWCVAYPSLCTAAAQEEFEDTARRAGLKDSELELIRGTQKVQLRFWVVDALQRLLYALKGR